MTTYGYTPSSGPAVVEMTGITKPYSNGAIEVEALRGIDLTVGEGEFVAIIGPSGSGKSTLMNIIGCLDVPTSGEYRLDGQDVARLSNARLADIRNQRIGFVFQQYNLLASMSAWRNVALPLCYAGVPAPERRRRALHALDLVGLADRAQHRPGELSGGQQQRVAAARALVTDPAIILADEPTGNLDSVSTADMLNLLSQLQAQGRTVVLITHDADVASAAHRIVHLRDGMVTADEVNPHVRPLSRLAGLEGAGWSVTPGVPAPLPPVAVTAPAAMDVPPDWPTLVWPAAVAYPDVPELVDVPEPVVVPEPATAPENPFAAPPEPSPAPEDPVMPEQVGAVVETSAPEWEGPAGPVADFAAERHVWSARLQALRTMPAPEVAAFPDESDVPEMATVEPEAAIIAPEPSGPYVPAREDPNLWAFLDAVEPVEAPAIPEPAPALEEPVVPPEAPAPVAPAEAEAPPIRFDEAPWPVPRPGVVWAVPLPLVLAETGVAVEASREAMGPAEAAPGAREPASAAVVAPPEVRDWTAGLPPARFVSGPDWPHPGRAAGREA